LPRLFAEKQVLQTISQKILTNKLWIDAVHVAIKNTIQNFTGKKIIDSEVKNPLIFTV
jgi:hypothetical protein